MFDDETVIKAAMKKLNQRTMILTRPELEEAKYEEIIEDQTMDGGLRYTVSDKAGS